MEIGYCLPWKTSVPEPPEPPMTMPALTTLKLMLPSSAYVVDANVTPASASKATRLARRADKARMGVAPWESEDANRLCGANIQRTRPVAYVAAIVLAPRAYFAK